MMIYYVIIGIVAFLILAFLCSYVKTAPDTAFVISGGTSKQPKYLVGTGGFCIPFIQKKDELFLGQVSVDLKTEMQVPTNDFVYVSVDAVAKVQVDDNMISLAARNFLNMSGDEIATELQDSLQGNLREIIGKMDLRSLNVDRDGFSSAVADAAKDDMAALGIKIISCNIQNITDKDDLIYNLGADNTAKIKKDAAINKANADRDVAIAKAIADQQANDARVKSETAIAEKNNELSIKKADLKKISDTKQAEADSAYEIEKQSQLKQINTKTVEAEIEKTKQEQRLTEERIKIKENELQAEVNKQSDAAKYALQVETEAKKYKTETDAQAELEQRKRKAEAEAYEAEQKARAVKAKADADRYAIEQEAEAAKTRTMMEAEANKQKMLLEAEGVKAYGEAEASAIEAKGLAEAEALRKKAEAYQSYNGSIKALEIVADKLPEVAKSIADPMSKIGNITIYGGGKDASQVSENVPVAIQKTFDTVSNATGVDLRRVLEKDTIEAKTDKNVTLNGPIEVVHKS